MSPPSKPPATPEPPAAAPSPPASDVQPTQIVVTMLSRGKGVPTETRDAYKQIRYVLEQQQANANVTVLQASRIGLEGETRLCAEFRNREDAQPALAQIRKLAAGVDLLDVAEAPCPSRKVDKP
jgi:hypothetical protein